MDTANPEFAGRIATTSRDVAANRSLSNNADDHGTNVAMVAAAARDNAGITGIAWGAQIAMFRADEPESCATFKANVAGSGCNYFDGDIAAGVNAAVAAGAKVINLSIGGLTPAASLRTAISNAVSAGAMIVISAGNDGQSTDPAKNPANPTAFATGLEAAGSGAVIIAGSVDANNVISAFSNRAGTSANWYLSARGEQVCCAYENGALKIVTNADGSRSVLAFSGTSFAAPQIAGAAALLREAFPNLTAHQVVDILLRSARDAGADGIDSTYGRGILDIAAAFSPRGNTSLAGSTVALPFNETTLTTSAPMGDALRQGAGLVAVVLDSYDRAYRVNLGAGIKAAQIAQRLSGALAAETHHLGLGNDRLSLGVTVGARGWTSRLRWAGALRMPFSDAQPAPVLAARIVTQITPGSQIAFGFAQGADGLVTQLQGRSQPTFLIASTPLDDLGFGRRGEASYAVRHAAGKWGLSLSAETSSVLIGAAGPFNNGPRQRHNAGQVRRFGIAIDRRAGNLTAALAASWLSEDRTYLGALLHEGFGSGGADTALIDGSAEWTPSKWHFGATWRAGLTWAHTGAAIMGGSKLATSAWAVDAMRKDVAVPGDSLGLRIAQPLRVESGGLTLNLPVDYSYATLTPTFATRSLSLSPSGRELDAELVWRAPLWNGAAMASAFYRKDPGHYAARPDDHGLALSWIGKF